MASSTFTLAPFRAAKDAPNPCGDAAPLKRLDAALEVRPQLRQPLDQLVGIALVFAHGSLIDRKGRAARSPAPAPAGLGQLPATDGMPRGTRAGFSRQPAPGSTSLRQRLR